MDLAKVVIIGDTDKYWPELVARLNKSAEAKVEEVLVLYMAFKRYFSFARVEVVTETMSALGSPFGDLKEC